MGYQLDFIDLFCSSCSVLVIFQPFLELIFNNLPHNDQLLLQELNQFDEFLKLRLRASPDLLHVSLADKL